MTTPAIPRTRQRLGAAAMILAVLVVAAACSGSTGASTGVASLNGKSSSSPTTTLKPADTRKLWLDAAKCMRGQGIDMPDPTFDANGRPQFNNGGTTGTTAAGAPGGGGGAGRIFRSDDPKTQAARKACSKYFDQIRGQFGARTPEQTAARKKALLDLAACMRGQGVDFPDPTFDANGRPQFNRDGAAAGGTDRRSDPAFQAAMTTCRTKLGSELQGGFGGGPGGGPGGGGAPAPTTTAANA
jgi:hypothetical protein